MNNKIFALVMENLDQAFSLERYEKIRPTLGANTDLANLPWTPARRRKFQDRLQQELDLDLSLDCTVAELVQDLDRRYMMRFFGEIWKPKTERFTYSGWTLVEEINQLKPKSVLDVGCGYNQFKERLPNLVGIDPFNNAADYQVDILEYVADPGSFDVIMALGSINFNSRDDIEQRFSKCVTLLAPGGHMFFRANPGISHKNGPWVDIFPWSFEVVHELSKKYNLKLVTFKKDSNERLYFVFNKPHAQ